MKVFPTGSCGIVFEGNRASTTILSAYVQPGPAQRAEITPGAPPTLLSPWNLKSTVITA